MRLYWRIPVTLQPLTSSSLALFLAHCSCNASMMSCLFLRPPHDGHESVSPCLAAATQAVPHNMRASSPEVPLQLGALGLQARDLVLLLLNVRLTEVQHLGRVPRRVVQALRVTTAPSVTRWHTLSQCHWQAAQSLALTSSSHSSFSRAFSSLSLRTRSFRKAISAIRASLCASSTCTGGHAPKGVWHDEARGGHAFLRLSRATPRSRLLLRRVGILPVRPLLLLLGRLGRHGALPRGTRPRASAYPPAIRPAERISTVASPRIDRGG